jgi:hypothetical protein
MILFADRDELQREGAQSLVGALLKALPYSESEYSRWRRVRSNRAGSQGLLDTLRNGLKEAAIGIEQGLDFGKVTVALVDSLMPHLIAARDGARQIEQLQRDLEQSVREASWYRRAYAELQESTEAARLSEMETQVDVLQEQKEQVEQRVRSLEQILASQRQSYGEEIRHLRTTIVDLNRIVAEQQKQLNDFLEDVV